MEASVIFASYSLLFAAAAYLVLRSLFGRRRPLLPLPPGPAGWPIVGCLPLLGAMPHVSLARMADKHGPLMYLKLGTSGVVVVSSANVARAIFKSHDHSFPNRPAGAGPTYIAYGAQDMVFSDAGPRWKLMRKLATLHMLGSKPFGEWAPLRHREVGIMVRSMYHAVGPLLVRETVSCALANVIGQKSISRRVFGEEESSDFKNMITELMRLAGMFNIGDFIPSVEWMDLQGVQRKMKKVHAKFDALIERMLEEHLVTAPDRGDNPDFFDVVMGIKRENGVELQLVNYKALLLNLFIAGIDTSSSSIEWAMTELLKNPRIIKKAQEEMDQVVGRNRRLEESDIPKLLYLQAICKETFRKHPVVPLNLPRVTTEACEINNYHIPKNTRLFVNMWAMGRDRSVWEDPLEFRPERLMGSSVEPWGNDYELIPFGAGRRICVGIRMGFTMVQFVVGTLVHCFDWTLPNVVEKIEFDEAFGLVLSKANRLEAFATSRLDPYAYDA